MCGGGFLQGGDRLKGLESKHQAYGMENPLEIMQLFSTRTFERS